MYRYFLLVGLAVLLGSTAALAQQRQRATERDVDAASGPATVFRVDARNARVLDPRSIELSQTTWMGRSGGVEDSIAYYDDDPFVTELYDFDDAETVNFANVELSERFTPGYGNTFGGTPPGQVSAFGFTTSSTPFSGPLDGGTLLVIFSKFEAGEPFFGYDRPSADLVLAVALDPSQGFPTVGAVLVEIDVTAFNLYFESDEEWIWGIQWDDDLGATGTRLRVRLDDGNATVTPPAEAGYYDPLYPRSGGILNYLGDPGPPPTPAGLYYFDWAPTYRNYWFFSKYLDGAVANLGVEISAACGPTSATCDFQANETLNYQVCFTNTSGATTPVRLRLTLFGPAPVPEDGFDLLDRAANIPNGTNVCKPLSLRIASGLSDGYYELRLNIEDPTDPTTVYDYDHFFFTKSAVGVAARGAAPASALGTFGTGATLGVPAPEMLEMTGDLDFNFEQALTTTPRAEVLGAFPNPFTAQTTIRYTVNEAAAVRLAVYDLLGREVAVVADGRVEAGQHEAVFDGSDLANGVYVYRLQFGGQVQTGRLTLLR